MIRRTQAPRGWERSKFGVLVPGVRHRPLDPCHVRYDPYRYELPVPLQAAFTFVNTTNDNAGSGSTFDISLSTTTGALLVAYCKHEEAAADMTFARSDGSESWLAADPLTHGNGDIHGRWFYLLAASGSGSVTYRLTTSVTGTPSARNWRSIIMFQYTYSGTCSLDGTPANASGASAGPNSGNMTTEGTDGVAFGGYGEYDGAAILNAQINGVAADGTVQCDGSPTATAAWRKTYSAGFTGAANCTIDNAGSAWLCQMIAFKATAGGGGGGGGFDIARMYQPQNTLLRM